MPTNTPAAVERTRPKTLGDQAPSSFHARCAASLASTAQAKPTTIAAILSQAQRPTRASQKARRKSSIRRQSPRAPKRATAARIARVVIQLATDRPNRFTYLDGSEGGRRTDVRLHWDLCSRLGRRARAPAPRFGGAAGNTKAPSGPHRHPNLGCHWIQPHGRRNQSTDCEMTLP